VAKINHDLRNMLTAAQIASDRLSASGDPAVAQAMPRLERALERAVSLAQNTLAYGRSEEPPPWPRTLTLAPPWKPPARTQVCRPTASAWRWPRPSACPSASTPNTSTASW
jgi:hypothetical protein